MTKHLFIGGLIAAGFDLSGKFLLTISHAGRGVFETSTWERVARDSTLAYPEDGYAVGIGPIKGKKIKVKENYEGIFEHTSPDGLFYLSYSDGTVTVTDTSS